MESFYSCTYIQHGINFYPNNIVKVCCFTNDSAVDACNTTEFPEDIIRGIFNKKAQMIDDFRNNKIYDCCSKCSSLIKQTWNTQVQPIRNITLNHFMSCNLKCEHCGYVEGRENGTLVDTNHERVLEIIQILKLSGVTAPELSFDVGGGEPSISKGLHRIAQYCIDNRHHIHINSNGANYVPIFADGANKGLLHLTLTPDAGSRDVFEKIKGRDNFCQTWKNIDRYTASCGQNVEIKFILQEGNIHDIPEMIKKCVETKPPRVVLSLDLRIAKEDYVKYAPYIAKFRTLAAQHGLQLFRSPLLPENLWNASA